ncbi:hypothetical protein SAMN04488543_1971 [Friedmanniella luteola]|uniref:VOC family protein n=1 Tax=Friedmanniella luteola TaxID=546871 RepID=A0A1H1T9S3_9ACTN|nr:hypothetical protein SAMN04488543_1971 [Friedmanniella luteola]
MTAIAPWLSVTDAAAAVEFYQRAFGATTGELAEGGGGALPHPTAEAQPGPASRSSALR